MQDENGTFGQVYTIAEPGLAERLIGKSRCPRIGACDTLISPRREDVDSSFFDGDDDADRSADDGTDTDTWTRAGAVSDRSPATMARPDG